MSAREKSSVVASAPVVLLGEIRQLIDAARQRAATAVNFELTLLYWRIGERIHTQVLAGRRAEYGEEIVATLSQQLSWSHFPEILPLKRPLQRESPQWPAGTTLPRQSGVT